MAALLTLRSLRTMAHQFQSGAFFHGKAAWHGLGTVVDGTMPAREAFRLADADWQVISTPIFDPTGTPIEGWQRIARSDTDATLSVKADSYTIVQNEQLIRIAEAVREDITMDAVVVLDGGRRVAFTAQVNKSEADVLPGDSVYQYLVGCTSHDGTVAFQTMFSPIRVVCQNTLSAALGHAENKRMAKRRLSVRHTTNANAIIEKLPEIICFKRQQFTAGIEELKIMASKPCLAADFRKYCENVFADQLSGMTNDKRGDKTTQRPKKLEDLSCWDSIANKFNGEGIGFDIKGVQGTYWGAYQAVSEYLTHDAGRSKDAVESARQRLESMWWGSAANTITKAHQLALAA